MIAVFATLCEMTMLAFFSTARFELGWYSTRLFGVVASTVLLIVLLTETTTLYARLARTVSALEHERDNKLMSARAITGAIAHEIRQPIAAVTSSASAGLNWLNKPVPD